MLSKQKREDEFFLEAVAKKKAMDSADLRRQHDGKEDGSKKRRAEKPLPKQKFAFEAKKKRAANDQSSVLDALAI
jgi:hypothetical protein